MSSKAIQRLKAEGYQTTGIHLPTYKYSKEEAIVRAKANGYYEKGNKVKVVQDIEVTHFRDGKSTDRYWVVMVLFTEEYKAWIQEKQEARKKEARQAELMKLTEGLSFKELTWMLKHKVDCMTPDEILEASKTEGC